mmetsp:Transcript_27306/g.89406  ORF Transcript_27306/g.89406 Transcript_27306/m.89406 type:complete len:556 (-) Transcript_27306:477-2144(-)
MRGGGYSTSFQGLHLVPAKDAAKSSTIGVTRPVSAAATADPRRGHGSRAEGALSSSNSLRPKSAQVVSNGVLRPRSAQENAVAGRRRSAKEEGRPRSRLSSKPPRDDLPQRAASAAAVHGQKGAPPPFLPASKSEKDRGGVFGTPPSHHAHGKSYIQVYRPKAWEMKFAVTNAAPSTHTPSSGTGSGGGAIVTGVPTGFMGKKFNPVPKARVNSGRDTAGKRAAAAAAAAKGSTFRSDVIDLEVALRERLQSLEEEIPDEVHASGARRLDVFSSVFEEIISRSPAFGELLRAVKKEYDVAAGRAAEAATAAVGVDAARAARAEVATQPLDEQPSTTPAPGPALAAAVVSPGVAERRAKAAEAQLAALEEENDRLRQGEERAQKSKESADAERAMLVQDCQALQRDNEELRLCLEGRDQDLQQLGQIIIAVSRQEIMPEQLAHVAEQLIAHDQQLATEAAPAPPSAFDGVPVEEVTWEHPLSSRAPIERPTLVPALPLANLSVLEAEAAPEEPPPLHAEEAEEVNEADAEVAAILAQQQQHQQQQHHRPVSNLGMR